MAQQTHPRGTFAQRARQQRKLILESLERRELMAVDVVTEWVEHLNDVTRLDTVQKGPTRSSRAYSMVQLAVYDAVNAIEQTHTPYALTTVAPPTASIEAAVATAASTVMKHLFVAQTDLINGWYQAQLAAIPDGANENDGVAIGTAAANQIISMRGADKSDVVYNYEVNPAPGHWSTDPMAASTQQVLGYGWGKVTPFLLNDVHDFNVPPPPAMDSAAYAAAYNEVKELGALNSATRTADQTEIGIFWAYDRPGFGPPLVLYNQNLIEIVTAYPNTVAENARLFALANVSMGEAGIAAWHSKYIYDFWRPVTAIRRGAEDGNAATVADANWVPLGAPGDASRGIPDFTPPFPAYASGHATFGGAMFQVLTDFYGTDTMSFTLHSDELPGVERDFTSFSQAAEENGRSRVYLGVHWEFDSQMGQQQGRAIADFVTSKLFQPLGQGNTLLSVARNNGGLQTIALAADADLLIRRSGANLQIINQATSEVLINSSLAKMQHITLDGRNGVANNLTLDLHSGPLTTPFTVEVLGGAGEGDGVTILGTVKTDLLSLAGDELRVSSFGPVLDLAGVDNVSLVGRSGNDTFTIAGDQTGRSIRLEGDAGNDLFKISSSGAELTITDSAGTETLDFTQATSAVELNLALSSGQVQANVGDNSLALQGTFENIEGSAFNDRLLGNGSSNRLRGWGGNDILRGEAGLDVLEGNDGDDILLGGLAYDQLFGGAGRDLLIGGGGVDLVNGQGGEDILIGGSTTHDGNEAALLAIMAEWTSSHSHADRINNLKNGSGLAPENNGMTFLFGPTLLNDNAVDSLFYTTGDFQLKFNNDRYFRG